jgi:hypothetical protein
LPFAGFHRFFAALLLVAYLLAGGGLARAVVWCVDESGHSHVEINPAGNCLLACDSAEAHQSDPELPGLAPVTPEKSCQDVVLLSSQVKDSRLSKLAPPQSAALNLPPPTLHTFAGSLSLPQKFAPAQPPVSLALAALRTVVLLN